MKFKYRPAGQGYFVQSEGKEWGKVLSEGGFMSPVSWRIVGTRERARFAELRKQRYATRREAAEALYNAHNPGVQS